MKWEWIMVMLVNAQSLKNLIHAWLFVYLLKDYNKPLWDGCTNHGKLLEVAEVFPIKLDHRLSEIDYDIIVKWTKIILPKGNRLKDYFYVAKFMMRFLILRYHKIDMSRLLQVVMPWK